LTERETIIIEPRSRIASFDTIGYRTVQAVNGAIAGTLFGKNRDKKSVFFKSSASRRNKQILSQLTSEIYSYLNGVISEFADPEDYFFRLWVRVEIDKKTGVIIENPVFDVDVFKYIGKVGGKYVEVGEYALQVHFIGKEGTHISPLFIRGIKKVASDTNLIKFRFFDSYSMAPEEIKQIITSDSPYLVIDDKPIEIKLKLNEENMTIVPFLEKNGVKIEFEDQASIESYILREISLRPDIIKSGTFFQYSDTELKKIEDRITQHALEIDEQNLLEKLNIEDILKEMEEKIENIKKEELSDINKKSYDKYTRLLKRLNEKYNNLCREWEIPSEDILKIQKDFEAGYIQYEEFSVLRVRRSTALRKIRQELIDFQEDLKNEYAPEFNLFIYNISEVIKDGKN